jgi:alkanesulfonate monooxygenase SsuD/methylene tetrahydromethanopterin reductase-like flavin-dependent oxidoreductase (luciferase family)
LKNKDNALINNSATMRSPAAHTWVTEGKQKVRFGILLMDSLQDWNAACQVVQFIESLGYDSLWVPDHPGTGVADCWTALAVFATTTSKIRLGSAVSCVSFRSPWHLARLAADVDRLSNGRLILGIGIGDNMEEFQMLDIPLSGIRTRQKVLEETIQIVQGLWNEPSFTYKGNYFQARNAFIAPGPIQQPYVPVLIAGGGEQVTLRQVAQYADMSNFAAHSWTGSAFSLEDITRKYRALRAHCEATGRPYDAILRSYSTVALLARTPSAVEVKKAADPLGIRDFLLSSTVAGTPSEVIPYYQALVDCGVQYFMVGVYSQDRETLSLLAEEVIPALIPCRV